MAWIQEKMVEAHENKITVLAMMHYGIVEHYTGQKNLEPLIQEFEGQCNCFNECRDQINFYRSLSCK